MINLKKKKNDGVVKSNIVDIVFVAEGELVIDLLVSKITSLKKITACRNGLISLIVLNYNHYNILVLNIQLRWYTMLAPKLWYYCTVDPLGKTIVNLKSIMINIGTKVVQKSEFKGQIEINHCFFFFFFFMLKTTKKNLKVTDVPYY